MLLQLMRKHTFQRSHLIGISNFLNDFSHIVVEVSGLDEPESSLSSLVGSQNDISLLSSNGSIFIGLDDNGVTNKCGKTINMYTQFDFDEVTLLNVD